MDHPNRGPHNWLVYRISDRMLSRFASEGRFAGELVDLGAGEAPYRDFFLRYATRYTSVDWWNSQHDSKPDVVADLNEPLSIASASVDTVVSLSVLEHLHSPQTMLAEAYRILRPGGSLVLEVPFQWRVHEPPHDYFRFTHYGIAHMLNRCGFHSVTIEPQGGFCTVLALKVNYFTRSNLVRGSRVREALLTPFWWFGQTLASLLDRFDPDPMTDTSGYYVTARK